MSDSGEVEVEAVTGYPVLPKEVTDEIGSIKLFNKWYVLIVEEKRAIADESFAGLTKMLKFAISP